MSISEYVSALLAAPAPAMTAEGQAELARAVLAIKLAFGDAPADAPKLVPARPASQSNLLYGVE